MTSSITTRAAELTHARRPYVHATVVRAQEPTSARAGDDAVILDDGSIEGFVGGVCAESSVRAAALDTLKDGNTLLLRVLPSESAEFPETPGALVVVNPCHSGGAIEIFLRPVLPKTLLGVVGSTPVARAVAELAAFLDFDVVSVSPSDEDRPLSGPDRLLSGAGRSLSGADRSLSGAGRAFSGAVAVVVAGLGRDEERAIRAALDAGVGYVALVASHKRGAVVLDGMGLSDAERARVRAHAGIDIGARSHKEIALAIVAEIVREIRANGLTTPGMASADSATPSTVAAHPQAHHTILPVSATMTSGGSPREGGLRVGGDLGAGPRRVVDPVCGMTVLVGDDTPHAVVDGQDHWFCRVGCRDSFVAG